MNTSLQPALFEVPTRHIPATMGVARIAETEATRLLTVPQGRLAGYDFSINPYRGCAFGCSYCYAAFFEPDPRKRADWGNWVEVKSLAVGSLRRAYLYQKRIYMSSATDPYQPIEARAELTRSILEALAPKRPQLVIQTRGPLVTRDIDVLTRFESVRVNMSITTDDDAVRRAFEPGCASIERRLEAVATLVAAGIAVRVCISPMLPMHDPEAFGRRLARMGVAGVTTGFFHHGRREFASGTRDGALSLSTAMAWDRAGYRAQCAALQRGFPELDTHGAGFAPAN